MGALRPAALAALALVLAAAGAARGQPMSPEAWWEERTWRLELGAGAAFDPVMASIPGKATGIEAGLQVPRNRQSAWSLNLRSHWVRTRTASVVVWGWDMAVVGSYHRHIGARLDLRANAGLARVSHEATGGAGTGRLTCYALATGASAAFLFDKEDGQAVGLDYMRWCAQVHTATLTYSIRFSPGGSGLLE